MKNKIILVKFPFVDKHKAKFRPALVLTQPSGRYKIVTVAYISSQVPAKLANFDLKLDINKKYFAKTGLKKSSVIKLNRLATVRLELIEGEFGHLPIGFIPKVKNKLKKLFSLN